MLNFESVWSSLLGGAFTDFLPFSFRTLGKWSNFHHHVLKWVGKKTGWCLVMSKCNKWAFKMAIFSTKWWANAQRVGGWPLAKKTLRRSPHEWESNGDRWGCRWKRSDVSAREKRWRSDLVGEILGRLRREDGREESLQSKKPGDGFKLILVFPCLFFFELSCFGYLFGACFASIIQLGDIPNTYINIHLFKGVYIGLISKGVPIPRAFPPFCLWIRGFPMLPGY